MENNEIINVELQATMDIDKKNFCNYVSNNLKLNEEDNYINQLKTIIYNFLFDSLDDNEISLGIDNIINYQQIENKMLNWAINFLNKN